MAGEGQNPDMGLLNWRKLEEHFGEESEYLGFLARFAVRGAAAVSCAVQLPVPGRRVEQGPWNRSPGLGDSHRLAPRTRESLDTQCRATLERNRNDMRDFANSVRALRRP